jgi:hypothetical protein
MIDQRRGATLDAVGAGLIERVAGDNILINGFIVARLKNDLRGL